MPQKAKPDTGAALPTTDQPDDDTQGGGQDQLVGTMGFRSNLLAPPRPAGPAPPSMGGDSTKPGNTTQQVADLGEKKGGPAVESKPVGNLRTPQDTGSAPASPEYKPAPMLQPPPTPPPATSTAQPPPAGQTVQPTDQGGQAQQPGQKPALDPYITNDPDYIGQDQNTGEPIFQDAYGRYVRTEKSPGVEIRHYEIDSPQSKEGQEGREHTDPVKVEATKQATEQANQLLNLQSALQNWKDKLAKVPGENWGQRVGLEAETSGAEGWQGALGKAFGGAVGWGSGGLTDEMRALEGARAALAPAYAAAFTRGEESPRITGQAITGVPTANDDLNVQKQKVAAMEDRMKEQVATIQRIFPNGNVPPAVREMLTRVTAEARQQNAATGNVTRSGGTTAGAPTQAEIDAAPRPQTADDLAKLKSGDLFIDLDGKPKRKH